MKLFVLKLFLITSSIGCCQNQQVNPNDLAIKFKSHYNNSDYEAIYDMFDDVLQNLLSREDTAHFLNSVKLNFGTITTMAYSGKKNSAYLFKTTFANDVVDMYFTMNDDQQISAFFIPRDRAENASVLVRNSTKMIFPFKEEAFVYWGGDREELNYHMADINQQYAYDILMVANGAPYQGDPSKNDSYFVFGKDILAQCHATVVKVIIEIKDNIPGEVNTKVPTGNTIILKTSRNEYLLLAHLKFESILVEEGDVVQQGQILAQCGNSGNTTQAHLHLQLQNTIDLYNTIGAQLFFDHIMVNGEVKTDVMPKKEDFVKNAKNF